LKSGFFRSDDFLEKLGTDGYRSFIKDYNWGSNQYKSVYGMLFYVSAEHSLFPANDQLYKEAAEDYLHYIHGVNPFGFVYLTNMNSYGASNSLTQIFHTWFDKDSPKWAKVGVSTYGPAPGFLAGGPKGGFKAPDCCPNKCDWNWNTVVCQPINHLVTQQPPAKSYADVNVGWPAEMWEIVEPSCGYQVAYIRLLSKFVHQVQDPNVIKEVNISPESAPEIYPNPSKGTVHIRFVQEPLTGWELFDAQMRLVAKRQVSGHSAQVDVSTLSQGIYFLRIMTDGKSYTRRVIVR